MSKTILLVDEDPAVRRMLCRVLAEENYEVLPVHDRAEAMERLGTTAVDLIILDPEGPIDKGWELVQEFRVRDPGRPVILVTTRPNQTLAKMNLEGVVLMDKPLDLLKLLCTIDELLKNNVSRRRFETAGVAASNGLAQSPAR
jgi:DNA-binding response OmpR family regulator